MRRLFLAAVVCAVILLSAASVAVAAPRYTAPDAGLGPHVAGLSHGQAVQSGFVPLARRLGGAGTGTISLNVYAWNSLAEVGADVDWYAFDDTG